jgi:undecaprenyl-diphosphatase
VQSAVAAHEHDPSFQLGRGAQRVPELGLARRDHRIRLGPGGGEAGRQLVRRSVRIGDAARPAVDDEEETTDLASVPLVQAMDHVLDIDRWLAQTAPLFENHLLTAVFVLVSAWWVKGPMLIGMGLCSDVWRRRLPLAFAAAAAATGIASLVVHFLKEGFDRQRPPVADPSLGSPVSIPDNPSFPSGHSATAFAAATAVAILSPRLRPLALGVAAAVAVSRVYLRVHFPLDVVAGAALGVAIGALCALVAVRLAALARPGVAAA